MSERPDPQSGYTLIELLIVVAMITTLIAVGVETLGQQPAQLSSSIQQFSAMVDETRALALANAGQLGVGDGTSVAAATGATLWVQPDPTDPNYTIATLYWYRPILQNPLGGGVQIDGSRPPLRLRVSVAASIPPSAAASSFAIFIAPSGHLSAISGNSWNPVNGSPISSEPACDSANQPQLTFSSGGNSRTMALQCNIGTAG
jgi:prepilin-type N-terminal cleavage/methylation domain-containing protein